MPTDPFKAKQQERDDSRTQCKFCNQVKLLPADKLKQLLRAMNDLTISQPVIADVLGDWGIELSRSSLQDHRNRSTGGSGSNRARCMDRLTELAKATGKLSVAS